MCLSNNLVGSLVPSSRLTRICNKMPKLLQGIVTVIDVFYQYATEYGNCDMLSKKEMKELLETEFHQILKVRTLYQD